MLSLLSVCPDLLLHGVITITILCACYMLIIVMHDDVGRWLSLLVVLLGWANPGTCM